MSQELSDRVQDLEARVVALQTLVGDLLRSVHRTTPAGIDRRLERAKARLARGPEKAVAREALHLEIAMLEAAVRER